MLPLQPRNRENRPLAGVKGTTHLIVPQRVDQVELSLEEYEESLPSEAELTPYETPVIYWNPFRPGVGIKPYPQLGTIHDDNGRIVCTNAAEEKAWRQFLDSFTGGNPDRLRDDRPADLAAYEFVCPVCHFRTTHPIAWNDHNVYWHHDR